MICIKIFIEQIKIGANVFTCSTDLPRISRWIWWVKSSIRFSTSLVTYMIKFVLDSRLNIFYHIFNTTYIINNQCNLLPCLNMATDLWQIARDLRWIQSLQTLLDTPIPFYNRRSFSLPRTHQIPSKHLKFLIEKNNCIFKKDLNIYIFQLQNLV